MTQLEHVGSGLGSAASRARREGYPAASRNFDLIALAPAARVLPGGYADGIVHVHGATDDSLQNGRERAHGKRRPRREIPCAGELDHWCGQPGSA
ncbi:MAG: hypothetical protein OXH77_05805 [Anaerolineaceae bacterium]|nr:hypothetical protein [Anaerolineaceae bacterium]